MPKIHPKKITATVRVTIKSRRFDHGEVFGVVLDTETKTELVSPQAIINTMNALQDEIDELRSRVQFLEVEVAELTKQCNEM